MTKQQSHFECNSALDRVCHDQCLFVKILGTSQTPYHSFPITNAETAFHSSEFETLKRSKPITIYARHPSVIWSRILICVLEACHGYMCTHGLYHTYTLCCNLLHHGCAALKHILNITTITDDTNNRAHVPVQFSDPNPIQTMIARSTCSALETCIQLSFYAQDT